MKFRLGFFLGAAASAVIVSNLSMSQRQRLRSAASNAVDRVKSTKTADRIVDEVVNADAKIADAVADMTPAPAV